MTEEISKIIAEYKTIYIPISLKQKKLIVALFSFQHDIVELNNYIQTKLNDSSKCINNLSIQDLEIIQALKNETKISEVDKIFLQDKFNKETIDEILKQEKKYEDITIKEFEDIIKHPSVSSFRFFSNSPLKKFFVLEHNQSYELGYTYLTSAHDSLIKYIKFFDLLTIDYDLGPKENKDSLLKRIKSILPLTLSFKIYETWNGYHVFLMSCPILHNSEEMMKLSYKLGSDPWYILYSKYYGYSIRLSEKSGRNELEFGPSTNNL